VQSQTASGEVASSYCDAAAPGALVARPSDVRQTSLNHVVVTPAAFDRPRAQHVEGACVDEIVNFLGGQVTLSSGQSFVVGRDGRVELDPIKREPNRLSPSIGRVPIMKGYDLLMTDRILPKQTYIGLFKSRSDYVIARFDVLNGKPSSEVDVLIRSKSPISSIDYLPGPDYPGGQIGFVQPAGKGKAWLYGYDWDHSNLRKLSF
jgi:hypothetical protein